MQPLSRGKRLGYLAVSFLLFFIIAPLAILYATGYRLGDAFTLTKTGGLYISVGFSGANVFINDSLVKETGVFQKGVLVQDLKPGSYRIRVEKEKLHAWQKELKVFPENVTDARVLMLPTKPEITEITLYKTENKDSTTTKTTTKNPEFDKVVKLFGPRTSASSTEPKILNKLSAENKFGKITVTWLGDEDSRPTFFCIGATCRKEIVFDVGEKIDSFYFLPGRDDLIIYEAPSGIYVGEIDNRSKRNIQPLLEKSGLDLRVDDNSIYIKNGAKYYFVAL